MFHVTAATIASWVKRVDEQGPDALVQIREPVNKFPDFVRFVVQQLKTLCPSMGKRKVTETLARADLHLGTTTVGNILKENPVERAEMAVTTDSTDRVVTSKYAEPPLECRPHDGSDRCRLLVLLASLHSSAAVALLLVAGGRRGALFPPTDGFRGFCTGAELHSDACPFSAGRYTPLAEHRSI